MSHKLPTPLAVSLAEEAKILEYSLFRDRVMAFDALAAFQRTAINGDFEIALRLFRCMMLRDTTLLGDQIEVLRKIFDITKDEICGIVSERVVQLMFEGQKSVNLEAAKAMSQILADGKTASKNISALLGRIANGL